MCVCVCKGVIMFFFCFAFDYFTRAAYVCEYAFILLESLWVNSVPMVNYSHQDRLGNWKPNPNGMSPSSTIE